LIILASSNPFQGLRAWLVLPFSQQAHQPPGGLPDLYGLPILEPRLIKRPYQIQESGYLIMGIEEKENSRSGKKEKVRGGLTAGKAGDEA